MRHSNIMLLCLIGSTHACNGSVAAPAAPADASGGHAGSSSSSSVSAGGETAALPPPGPGLRQYVVDFSGISGGGIETGYRHDLWLTVDPSAPYYAPVWPAGYPGFGFLAPDVYLDQQVSSGCSGAVPPPWAKQVSMPTGPTVELDHIDVVMRSAVPGGGPEPAGPQTTGFCFGYRAGGVWQWRVEPQFAVWEPDANRYLLTLPVGEAGVDAFVVMATDGPSRILPVVSYTIRDGG